MAAPLDKRLLQRATATRTFLVAVGVVGILNAVLVIAQAWLMAHAIAGVFYAQSLTFDGPLPSFGAYLLAILAIFVVRGGLSWLSAWLAHRASAAVKSQLRTDIMEAALATPSEHHSSSSLITLVTSGLDALDGYFEKYLPQLVMAAFIPVMIIAVVWSQDLQSALIIGATIPLIPIFMVLIGLNTQAAVSKRYRLQTRLANHFADLITGLPTLQVFGRARAQHDRLDATESDFRKVTLGTLRIAFLSGGVLELLATLSVALVAVTIGFRVVDGDMTLFTSLFILVLAPEAYQPIRMVGVHFHDSANGNAAAQAAFAVIEKAEALMPGTTPAPDLRTSNIRFEKVNKSFDGTPVLDEFSLTVQPGESVALTGRSGAGKSTLLAILMGFLRPDAGQVSVDGIDLAQIDPASWRSQIAWVAQEPGMIRGTIADNIALGSPTASARQQRSALDRAGGAALDLERHVGDDGEGLSAGERRRVALARALLRIEDGARLLVMDEPTAGLDQATEATAIEAVRASGAGTLFITHREAMLALADRVVTVPSLALSAPGDGPTQEVTR